MKEHDEYRCVLADLKDAFGNRAWITSAELAKYEGSDVRTVNKRYGIPKGANGIDRSILAQRKCRMAN